MADEIKVQLTFEGDKTSLDKTLSGAVQSSESAGRQAGDKFSRNFLNGFNRVGGTAIKAGAAITAAIGGLVGKNAFDAAASLESIRTRFEVLSGSATQADKQIRGLIDFAARTPFQLEGLANASARLQAFGFEQETIIDRLGVLGDLASGSGADIGELALILGQVSAAGKLTGERLLQLEERGIIIGPALAKSFGIAESKVREFVSSGKVGLADVEAAFKSLTSEGGRFFGATEKQSKTLTGLVSTLKDNFFALNVSIGEAFGPIFKRSLQIAISGVQQLTESVRVNSDKIIERFFAISKFILERFIVPIELASNAIVVLFGGSFSRAAALFDIFVGTIKRGLGLIGRALEALDLGGDLSKSLQSLAQEGTAQLKNGFGEFARQKDQLLDFSASLKVDEFLSELQRAADESADPLNRLAKNVNGVKGGEEGVNAEEVIGLTDALTISLSGLANGFTSSASNIGDALAGLAKRSIEAGKQIRVGLANGIGQGFAAFGKAIANGDNALDAFAKSILATFAQLAIQQGTFFILEGIALQFVPGAQAQGSALIAAGAGLATFGGVLSAISGGGGASAPASGGALGQSSVTGENAFAQDQTEEREEPSTQVAVNIAGDVLDSEETGLRVVEILNDAFDKQGVVINRGLLA